MHIIIPLCGKGERFLQAGYHVPKPLIRVFDKEIISYVLDSIKTFLQPTDSLYIPYHQDLDQFNFDAFIQDKYPFVHLIRLHEYTRGAAETVNIALNKIINKDGMKTDNKDCLLLDGDTFYTTDIISKTRLVNENAILYNEDLDNDNSNNHLFSYITLDKDNNVTDVIEKIKISSNANVGAYYFKSLHDFIKYSQNVIDDNFTFKGEFYTTCVIKCMLTEGHKFQGIKLNNRNVISLGTPAQVNSYIKDTCCFLFDLDGTLVLSNNVYYHVWADLLAEYNIILTQSIFEKYISGKNDDTVVKHLLPFGVDTTNLSRQKDNIFLKHIDKMTLVEGSVNFLQHLSSLGHKICIVTNCNRIAAETLIKYFGLKKYIDHLIIGSECKNPKPLPDPYLDAMKFFNTTKDKCIIFEDSIAGMKSASLAIPTAIIGLTTCMNEKELTQVGANYCAVDYTQMDIDVIKTIIQDNKRQKLIDVLHDNLRSNGQYICKKNIVLKNNGSECGYIADICFLDVNLPNQSLQCVLKLEKNTDNVLKDMALQLDLYENEYYFYNNVHQYVDLHVPRCYHIIKNQSLKSIGILLQDLSLLEHTCLNPDLNNSSLDISLHIIKDISKMHAKFWNKPIVDNFPKLGDKIHLTVMTRFIKTNWNVFKHKWSSILSNEQIHIGDTIYNQIDDIVNYMTKDNLTICHGDLKAGNIFYNFENNIPYFIDWQYINHGKGVSDIVFMMIESYEIDVIKMYNNLLLEYYYLKLKDYGVECYNKEDFVHDYRLSACVFPFFVATWFGVLPNEQLPNPNFPYFYIQRLFHFLQLNDCAVSLQMLQM
jgi:HAD superfamily hydrolase (TIGR01509 family)